MFRSKPPSPQPPAQQPEPDAGKGFFGRLKDKLAKTRDSIAAGLGNLLLGERELDAESMEDLETTLLLADVGVDATRRIVDALTERVQRRELVQRGALRGALSAELIKILDVSPRRFAVDPKRRPFVVLVVGVNGVGKTTTIGKLAARLKRDGRNVVLAAGDTFRAAAVQQLQIWGDRLQVPVIAQAQGSDAASVIFDALQAAQARDHDVVIADTAGRLHNRSNLMSELEKIGRIIRKFDAEAPHEVLLVLDAVTGQNALNQAKEFMAAVPVTGLVLTKLDGTAKGGIAFALTMATKLPIYFVGVGEAAEDLRPFDPEEFVNALLDRDVQN
jgi:fused signal recognition particle receptor